MADLKISQLGSITVLTPATDVLPVVDSGGVTKKITTNQILGSGGTATLASATITGALGAAGLNVTGATIPANGVYLGSANNLSFSYASTLGMTLNATGLGVGVSPSYKLDVTDNSTNIQARLNSSNNNGTSLRFVNTGTSGRTWQIGTGFAVTAGNFEIYDATAAVNRLSIDTSGNVGIGVASAANRLEAQEAGTGSGLGGIISSTATAGGNAGYVLRTGGTNRWSISLTGTAGAESIRFYDVNAAATRMTLDSAGNLILQSSATPATLTVNGQLTVNATSNTNLRFSYRGSDGTTRVANITLA